LHPDTGSGESGVGSRRGFPCGRVSSGAQLVLPGSCVGHSTHHKRKQCETRSYERETGSHEYEIGSHKCETGSREREVGTREQEERTGSRGAAESAGLLSPPLRASA